MALIAARDDRAGVAARGRRRAGEPRSSAPWRRSSARGAKARSPTRSTRWRGRARAKRGRTPGWSRPSRRWCGPTRRRCLPTSSRRPPSSRSSGAPSPTRRSSAARALEASEPLGKPSAIDPRARGPRPRRAGDGRPRRRPCSTSTRGAPSSIIPTGSPCVRARPWRRLAELSNGGTNAAAHGQAARKRRR